MQEAVSSIESLIELVSHIIIIIIINVMIIINFTPSYISSQLCEVCPILY